MFTTSQLLYEWKKKRYQFMFFVIISLLFVFTLTTKGQIYSDNPQVVELTDWIQTKPRGFYNDKLEIKNVNANDQSSRLGVFATEDILQSELLLSIPLERLITSDEAVTDYQIAMQCGTVKNLIKELRKGNNSKFAPYIKYLLTQTHGQLPSGWSPAGKELLQEVLGFNDDDLENLPPEYPTEWLDDWFGECDGKNDPLEVNAALMTVQLGREETLIPLYDMMRHRNGHWLNTIDNSIQGAIKNGNSVKVRASRDIQKGEEIYRSYNFCSDCGKMAETYGTFEILRDHGFVESFPQRWIFNDELAFEIDEVMNGSDLSFKWLTNEPDNEGKIFLHEHLERLEELAETKLKFASEEIPKNELDTIVQFQEALTVALTHVPKPAFSYDKLQEKEDTLPYEEHPCDTQKSMAFDEYIDIDQVKSHYQTQKYYWDPKNKDTCFNLDEIVQICGNYRPHYHEMVVHYTGRYLKNVKRVVWVGGGDSMLLHEILKYPNIELVIGLEIDQKVTRTAFKHFGTQPHWDDDKVQWWYGDAAKSLLMLPKDYFGSFDMVLVDLSETVASNSVTEELDIFDALALLLKPDGILVKNELYLNQMSKIFKYAIQVHYYDVPIICSQALALGSNKIDFLYNDLFDHKINNLFIKPLDKIEHRYEDFHDYRRNKFGGQRHCKDANAIEEEPVKQLNSPGIIMILEAEDVTVDINSSLQVKNIVMNALEKESFSMISTVLPEDNDDENISVVVILLEGYIVVRAWPDNKYCALDIHLWSNFENLEGIEKSLLAAFGSESSSSYRIVAGGMFGVSTWKEDEKNRGPRKTQICDESTQSIAQDSALENNSVDIILMESMSLLRDNNAFAVVLCDEHKPCNSLEILKKNDKISEVIPLTVCPNLKNINEHTDSSLNSMLSCHNNMLKNFLSLTIEKKIRVIVLDSNAPIELAQIVLKIFRRYKRKLLSSDILVTATMLDETETWKRNWLERFRHDIVIREPLYRAEVLFNASDARMEMGVTSSGDEVFTKHLVDVISNIEEKTSLVSDVRNIKGGLWKFQQDFDPPFFLPDDYDQSEPLKQWNSQQPVGLQNVFQLENTNAYRKINLDQVKNAVEKAVITSSKIHEFSSVGDGFLFVSLISGGTVVVTWDGHKHIDINLFIFSHNKKIAKKFLKDFQSNFPHLKLVLHDEQPRGLGRVVSFLDVIEPRTVPRWA